MKFNWNSLKKKGPLNEMNALARGSVEKVKEVQGLFSFLPELEVLYQDLVWGSSGFSSCQCCATQSWWMLFTLVIAIGGTFPYALRAVAIPWSPDQDTQVLDPPSERLSFWVSWWYLWPSISIDACILSEFVDHILRIAKASKHRHRSQALVRLWTTQGLINRGKPANKHLCIICWRKCQLLDVFLLIKKENTR